MIKSFVLYILYKNFICRDLLSPVHKIMNSVQYQNLKRFSIAVGNNSFSESIWTILIIGLALTDIGDKVLVFHGH